MLSELFKYLPTPLKKVIERPFLISWAVVDPNWFWFFKLMCENACIKNEYQSFFIPNNKDDVFIDCGANVWMVTDIARFMWMECYIFEPNPQSIFFLRKKYNEDTKVHLYPKAVSNINWKMNMYVDKHDLCDLSGTVVQCSFSEKNKDKNYVVDIVRLTDVIKNDILKNNKRIHLLKLDIEWAEFDVVEDIINEWLYKDIKYIVVETHERFFKDGKSKLEALKSRISELSINNIFLDWI